jgi:radical SAM protein with 4Fe4S-binding SPASM domain
MQLKNKEIRIENTNRCLLNCIMCTHNKMTRPQVQMPMPHFYRLIDQAYGLGAETISIFGFGEPLMDAFLDDKIAYCSKRGLKTFVTTNATWLDTATSKRLLDAGLTHIRFSFHGTRKAEYENVMKGADFDQVKRNIMNFLAINRDLHDNRCDTSVSVIPMHKESIEDIRAMWEPYIKWLEVWRPHSWCNTKSFRKGIRTKELCKRPSSGPIQIQADGKVIPCCFLTDGQIILGDTYQNTIEQILKGDAYNDLRKRHEDGNLEGLPCNTCDQLFEYTDENHPLLYSNRDESKTLNCTSSTKYKLGG